MRLVSYQPQYFPRLHYFARILDSDIFAIADYVQFVRTHVYEHGGERERGPSYQAHTPIKTADGVLLIDVPTKKGLASIDETPLAFASAKERLKNLRILKTHYRTAPQAESLFPILEAFFAKPHQTLAEIDIGSTVLMLAVLLELPDPVLAGIPEVEAALRKSTFRLRRLVPFSQTPIPPSDKESGRDANQWLVDACKHFGATEYLYGGTAASAYMDFAPFKEAGIALVQQAWKSQPYIQLHGEYLPNLSIIDLLMNVGPWRAREILHTD